MVHRFVLGDWEGGAGWVNNYQGQGAKKNIQILDLREVVTSVIALHLAYMHVHMLTFTCSILISFNVLSIHKNGEQAEQLKFID